MDFKKVAEYILPCIVRSCCLMDCDNEECKKRIGESRFSIAISSWAKSDTSRLSATRFSAIPSGKSTIITDTPM